MTENQQKIRNSYRIFAMRSTELARRLNVTDAAVRQWTEIYKDHLSHVISERRSGAPREFTEADAVILATVAALRNQGYTHDQCKEKLIEGVRVSDIPSAPDPAEDVARQAIQLVPIERVAMLQHEIDRLQKAHAVEVDRLVSERDSAVRKAEEASEELRKLEREIGRLEGELSELRKRRGLFGR